MSRLNSIVIQGKPLTVNEYVYENNILMEINKLVTPEFETWDHYEYICDKCNNIVKDVTKICYKCNDLCYLREHQRFTDFVCKGCCKLINSKIIME